jgi:hypothetical protein
MIYRQGEGNRIIIACNREDGATMTKSGLNIFDLLELSPLHRQVVRLLLREKLLSEAALFAAFPDDSPEAVRRVLNDLVKFEWLQCGESQTSGEMPVYHLHLERIPSSESLPSLWEKVEALSQRPAPDLDLGLQRGGKRKLPNHIWDKLDE